MEFDEINNKDQIIKFIEEKSLKDPSLIPFLGALRHPFMKEKVRIFSNFSLDNTPRMETEIIVLKMPSCRDCLVELKGGEPIPREKKYKLLIWCSDKEVKHQTLDISLEPLFIEFTLQKAEKHLFNISNSTVEELGIMSLRKEYDFRPLSLPDLHENILQYYDSKRMRNVFELSVLLKLNYGAFEKNTGQLCGWVFIDDVGSCNALMVLPKHRNKNLGKYLICKCMEICKIHGIPVHGFAPAPRRSYVGLTSVQFHTYTSLYFHSIEK